MICKPCAAGADLISAWLPFPPPEHDVVVAKGAHDNCQGCDCQCDVEAQLKGKVIRR